MSFWKTPAFKTLQKAWYKRLESEGFQDAEEIIAEEHRLKQSAANPYKRLDAEEIGEKEEYYQCLTHRISEFEFASDVHKTILEMFAEGVAPKKICEELDKQGTHRDRNSVRYIIRRYEMKWGLRKYTDKQLNKKAL